MKCLRRNCQRPAVENLSRCSPHLQAHREVQARGYEKARLGLVMCQRCGKRKRWKDLGVCWQCHLEYDSIVRAGGVPGFEQGVLAVEDIEITYRGPSAAFEALDTAPRCTTCDLILPCGGHRTSRWYAEHREHAE